MFKTSTVFGVEMDILSVEDMIKINGLHHCFEQQTAFISM
jgi:hypothetical protein